MAKKLIKSLVAGAALAGAAYLVYKNKDKLTEVMNEKFPQDDESDDDIFEEDDEVIDTEFKDSPIEAYDTTDDGKVDTVAIDNDGDGRPDELLVDTDGDGKADTRYVDTTGDGIVDTVEDITEE